MIGILKKHFMSVLPLAASTVACLMIISKSDIASEGIINGLKICYSVIIPSLFPFMVFSTFVIKSGIYIRLGKILGKPIKLIFNLPACSSGAVIMGFIGGYPIGINITAELLELGAIEENQAKRLALFSVNAGPAFVVSAIGGVIYQSKSIGCILLASTLLSSVTIGVIAGIISRIKGEKVTEKAILKQHEKFLSAFVSSTESGARAILSICMWVVTFGAIISFTKSLPISKELSVLLCGILEVTSGCTLCVGVFPLAATAAMISFSGFCIFFQLMPCIKKIGLKFSSFVLSRIACAALSFIYCTALTKIFPNSVQVFSNASAITQSFSVSIPAIICLVATCIVLIFDVDRTKKMC